MLCKIFEKLINKRLTNYLDKYNVLSDLQFGFRHARSTEDAVIALTTLIIEKLDNRKKCISVFLDLQKAFNTISIPTLIHKLDMIGIRGTPLRLFSSYLTDRSQKVKLESCTSDSAGDISGGPG